MILGKMTSWVRESLSASVFVYLICVLLFAKDTSSFPSGAPAEACESLSPERGHGVPSMPVQYAPFTVIAYGRQYRPGEKIPGKTFAHILYGTQFILYCFSLLSIIIFTN